MRIVRELIVAGSLAACALALAQAAGSVQVNFDKPDDFTDIGRNPWDKERNLQLLREHFQGYASRLPAGQALKIEVLDVDLAGQQRPASSEDIRVLTGRADWPRIQLRWTLSAGDRVLKSGEDSVADMSYLQTTIGLQRQQPLVYENRMLDRWFAALVAGGSKAH